MSVKTARPQTAQGYVYCNQVFLIFNRATAISDLVVCFRQVVVNLHYCLQTVLKNLNTEIGFDKIVSI